MTHVVNLLPWRDLRRRQRLRYVLLLTIGIVLLGGMGLLVSRTARLQRDFLATLHTTADAQLLASLKQREQAMREAWQQHQWQRQQYQRRSAIAAWRPQGSGGEMELTLSWSTVPALFSWLARCGMNPRSFSLGREAQTLRLRLLLEAEDER
ncbi:pilus assembly protein PilO [Klebsiella pneumoniae]|uniref:HofO family protein n=1 Tax=Klebsiella pneumoniae TaxID=573 RepID=UPI00215DB47C|nr:pilus assembly protein PilO [Klebsiella pneumoniae]UTW90222.1 pilus assembly protein PilO [Klebsiella pneumoniae subsp. pneumoniae]